MAWSSADTFVKVLLSVLALTVSAEVCAKDAPAPPCGSAAYPAHSSNPIHPNVEIWSDRDLPVGWEASKCAAWASERFTTLVAVSGEIPGKLNADDILERFGAIASLRGLPYWSTTDRRLEPLIVYASAVAGQSSVQPRPDFTAAELRGGKHFFFVERDNRIEGDVLYRLSVVDASADRVVIELDNISPIRMLFLTVFSPGDLHSSFFLSRLTNDRWGYYSLSGARQAGLAALGSSERSVVNRSLALYAHHAAQTANSKSLPWAK